MFRRYLDDFVIRVYLSDVSDVRQYMTALYRHVCISPGRRAYGIDQVFLVQSRLDRSVMSLGGENGEVTSHMECLWYM